MAVLEFAAPDGVANDGIKRSRDQDDCTHIVQATEGRSDLPRSTRRSAIEGMQDTAIMDDRTAFVESRPWMAGFAFARMDPRTNKACPACVTGEGFDAGRIRG